MPWRAPKAVPPAPLQARGWDLPGTAWRSRWGLRAEGRRCREGELREAGEGAGRSVVTVPSAVCRAAGRDASCRTLWPRNPAAASPGPAAVATSGLSGGVTGHGPWVAIGLPAPPPLLSLVPAPGGEAHWDLVFRHTCCPGLSVTFSLTAHRPVPSRPPLGRIQQIPTHS